MTDVRVLVFAGSLRKASLNHRLATAAAAVAEAAGARVTLLRLADYPMPVYDGDLEDDQGVPEAALALSQEMQSHDAFLIASPEYNGSIPGAFKNAIDWISRPVEGEPSLAAFKGKTVGLLAASPGALGGIRSLSHVRAILSHVGCLVLGEQMSLPKAGEAFDEQDALLSGSAQKRLDALVNRLLQVARGLQA